MHPRYPFPWSTLWRLGLGIVRQNPVSFREESSLCLNRWLSKRNGKDPFLASGTEYIPTGGHYLLTANHYTRPGFLPWWLVMGISAVVPQDICWVITSGWNFGGRLVARASRSIFPRIATAYGFTTMPPMPPAENEMTARASSIRKILAYVEEKPDAVIGLMPEGRDEPERILVPPFPGTGRFMLQLARRGLDILPCGLYEADGTLFVRFGLPYSLEVPPELKNDERDREASRIVMSAIAALLPEEMRGAYS